MTQHLDIWPIGGGPTNGIDLVYLGVIGDLVMQVRVTHQDWWARSGAGALVPSFAFKDGATPRISWGRPAEGVSVRLTRGPVLDGSPNAAEVAFADVCTIMDAVERRFDLGPYPPIGPLEDSVARVEEELRRLAHRTELARELLTSMRDRLEPWLVRLLELDLEQGRSVAGVIDQHRWLYAIETTQREEELLSALLPIRWNPGWHPDSPAEQRAKFEQTSAELAELDREIQKIYDAGDATAFAWSPVGSAEDSRSKSGDRDVAAQPAPDRDRAPDADEDDDEDLLPPAHPAFTAHFTDDIYEQADHEFAPHGTDQGYDLVWHWAAHRHELDQDATLLELLQKSDLDDLPSQLDRPEPGPVPAPGGQIDAATFIVAAAFTLLRLTGQLDEGGKQLSMRALEILIRRYGPMPDLLRQQDDLRAWPPGT
jgi:hypothetical protein